MEDTRLEAAVNLLKRCKSQRKTYYEATKVLEEHGYDISEISQSSYHFPYSGINQPGNYPGQKTVQILPNDISRSVQASIKLEEAKQYVVRDVWYQNIPIIGTIYRFKWFSDFANYESLNTGYRKSTVMLMWVVVMIVGMCAALTLPVLLSKVHFLPTSALIIYLSHYVGAILAIVLLLLIFRTKKNH